MMTSTLVSLPNYQIGSQIYQSSRTLVYRGIRETDNTPVIIKILQNEYPTFHELVQFRNQYVITRNLEHQAIVQPLALERYRNGYALVMPDEGAISLPEYWQPSSPSITDFLSIAIQLVQALHYLSQKRIIHKDIKPANILIHPQTCQVKLIDFSISSLLPTEQQQLTNPNVLEGTLAYISPEQTGRMNRGIDYRTDFYSLGVTFYKLLTGELPFTSDDPMELVHCHIAKPAQFKIPHSSFKIPQILADIVLKLMAKNAEDRYQNALGLKHDLEKCLSQWKEARKIETFELGERDKSDRFTIPQKLYGRENEVKILLDAFEEVAKGATQMMLVAGFSGIGKTAVINEVHKPIVRQRGYFIKGKFDQFNRNIPFSAFVQAFRDLMDQLLSESDTDLANWKTKILEAVGDSGQVLIEVIPELERIIGAQPTVSELSGSALQNRFNLLFQKFIALFTTPEHPLVIFLDDLQWADVASLNLMKVLMGNSKTGYLLMLGAYRDNEVYPAHPLMLTLDEIVKNEAIVNTVTLEPLSQSALNHLIADTLSCSSFLAIPLTELAYQKTKGNPFFATQFLKGLHEDGWISFNSELGYWQCDMVMVRQLALTDDVVEFMATQLQKLPLDTQEVLKLSACIGNQFDLATLAIVSERSETETATALWKALQEGFVLPTNEVYKFYQFKENAEALSNSEERLSNYKFLHDRVQQAAYSLIPSESRSRIHLEIAEALRRSYPPAEVDNIIFELANHYKQVDFDALDKTKIWQIIEIFINAGKKAKVATAFEAADEYFNFASNQIDATEDQPWEVCYEFMFEFHVEIIKVKIACANWNDAEMLANALYEKSRNSLDRSLCLELSIEQNSQKGEFETAIEQGYEALTLLDEKVAQINLQEKLEEIVVKIQQQGNHIQRLSADSSDALEDRRLQRVLAIFNALGTPTYLTRLDVWKYINARIVQIALMYGRAPESVAGLARFGQILCGRLDRSYKEGLILGQVAMELSDLYPSQKCIACFGMGLAINHWANSPSASIDFFQLGFQSALESGNMLYAGYNLMFEPYYRYYAGQEISQNFSVVQEYLIFSERTKNSLSSVLLEGISIHLERLNGNTDAQTWKSKSADFIDRSKETGNFLAVGMHQVTALQISYLLEDVSSVMPKAIVESIESFDIQQVLLGYYSLVEYEFYRNLLEIRWNAKLNNPIAFEQKTRLQNWVAQNPRTCRHKYDLVQAERCRIAKQNTEAMELYDRAIAGAKENEFIQEEALANELAAKFYLHWGKDKFAASYMQEAYYCYARWGAKAKINQLEEKYPQLLTPILQQQRVDFNSLDSLESLSQTLTVPGQTPTQSSSSSVSEALDFTSILQVSQALSSTIELAQLMGDIVQIILTNAGAEKAALLIPQSEQWHIRSMAQLSNDRAMVETNTTAQILTAESPVPIRLIRYVKNTLESVLIEEGKTEITGILEGYLLQYNPQSVLCVPLLNQGNLVAILYLEHIRTKGIFTPYRQKVVQVLTSQAAISLQNAQLYDQAQQALTDLQKAQLQIVQSEKMSALGNLVAGVAHEINNPTGFLQGNIKPAQDYVQDLLGLIDLYQSQYPQPNEAIEEEIEEIDLEFIAQDLPKLLGSMNLGVERIRDISNSLRTFSRQDQDYKTAFNIHEGIDSTLLILKHRTKANEERPKIQVKKEYGEIPKVQCFPGQLNQVFMNIFANAIDAFEEANQGKTYDEIEAKPNTITINTSIVDENQVQIEIKDNGYGIKPDTQSRIFEQGFTTKGVGEGTGLGLAISYQIITDKHSGTITCNSQLGEGTAFIIKIPL